MHAKDASCVGASSRNSSVGEGGGLERVLLDVNVDVNKALNVDVGAGCMDVPLLRGQRGGVGWFVYVCNVLVCRAT